MSLLEPELPHPRRPKKLPPPPASDNGLIQTSRRGKTRLPRLQSPRTPIWPPARPTCTARVKKTPASDASFFMLKSMAWESGEGDGRLPGWLALPAAERAGGAGLALRAGEEAESNASERPPASSAANAPPRPASQAAP